MTVRNTGARVHEGRESVHDAGKGRRFSFSLFTFSCLELLKRHSHYNVTCINEAAHHILIYLFTSSYARRAFVIILPLFARIVCTCTFITAHDWYVSVQVGIRRDVPVSALHTQKTVCVHFSAGFLSPLAHCPHFTVKYIGTSVLLSAQHTNTHMLCKIG